MPHRLATACLLSSLALAACGGASEPAPAPAAPAAQPSADHYSGHWRGVADITTSIPDAPSEMDIEATITPDGGAQCGTIEYGSIGCSGVWSCTGGYDQPVMVIQETIRFGGQERCPANARVELRRTDDPNVLEFHYSSPRIQGTGTISRQQL